MGQRNRAILMRRRPDYLINSTGGDRHSSTIVRAASAGWKDRLTVTSLAAGIVLPAGLILNEARVAQPIMPLHLLASRERSAAYAARVLFPGAMMGFGSSRPSFSRRGCGSRHSRAALGSLP
jgi:hypothetical protein